MKIYEKPRLVALSLVGNETLCDSCGVDVIGDNGDPYLQRLLSEFDSNLNNLFSAKEPCETKITVGFEEYCKFTAADEGLISLINS